MSRGYKPSGSLIVDKHDLDLLLKDDDDPEWHLQSLYKISQTGKIRQWNVEFRNPYIFCTSMFLDNRIVSDNSKPVVNRREIKTNKSGRSVHHQALLESMKRFNDKIRIGFSTDMPYLESPNYLQDDDDDDILYTDNPRISDDNEDNIQEVLSRFQVNPRDTLRDNQLIRSRQHISRSKNIQSQLARPYNRVDGTRVKIEYPVVVDHKMDGIRSRSTYDGQDVEFISRNTLKINYLDHIRDEMRIIHSYCNGYDLDGELYIHGMSRQELQSIIFTKKHIHPRNDEIKYYIFDIIIPNMTRIDRVYYLINLLVNLLYLRISDGISSNRGSSSFKHVFFVASEIIYDQDGLDKFLDEMLSLRYEGIMIRHSTGPKSFYKGGRNNNLLKYKLSGETDDLIVDVTSGVSSRTLRDDLAIFVVRLKSDLLVNIVPDMSEDERIEIFHNKQDYIGKYLVYTYNEFSNDGIPMFARGKYVRMDI